MVLKVKKVFKTLLTRGRKGPLALPINLAMPAITGARIGETAVLSFGNWRGAASLSGELLHDGVVVQTGLMNGQFVHWSAGDNLAEMVLRITAQGEDGGFLVLDTTPVMIRHAPPIAAGRLPDAVFDTGEGDQLIEAGLDFSGEDLMFSLSGGQANIDRRTGVVHVPTDKADSSDITVIAQNSGGSAKTTFSATVETPDAAGDGPIVIYHNTFTSDGTGDFDAAFSDAEISHDTSATMGGTTVAGAMKFEALGGETNKKVRLSVLVPRNTDLQVLLRCEDNNAYNTYDTTKVLLLDGGGNILTMAYNQTNGAGAFVFNIPAHPRAVKVVFQTNISGQTKAKPNKPLKASQFYLHEFGVYDVTGNPWHLAGRQHGRRPAPRHGHFRRRLGVFVFVAHRHRIVDRSYRRFRRPDVPTRRSKKTTTNYLLTLSGYRQRHF